MIDKINCEQLTREILAKSKEKMNKERPNYWDRVEKYKRLSEQHDIKLSVWLGGPGKSKDLYFVRKLFKCLLEKMAYKVVMSDEKIVKELVTVTEVLIDAWEAFLIVIFPISYGAVAESVLFTKIDEIRDRLQVFMPITFKDGFVYRYLRENLGDKNFKGDFQFNKLKECNVDLFAELYVRIEKFRARFFPYLQGINNLASKRNFQFP